MNCREAAEKIECVDINTGLNLTLLSEAMKQSQIIQKTIYFFKAPKQSQYFTKTFKQLNQKHAEKYKHKDLKNL